MAMISIDRTVSIKPSVRTKMLEGIFDVPPSERSCFSLNADLPIDFDWNIGLIVGPSGCGKTTVARELFSEDLVSDFPWQEDRSIVDDFPEKMSIKEITATLSSVGFSSPPSWLKPFRVLSNGEQFRVNLARALSEHRPVTVFDEFTSVVDRTVAKVASAALSKAVRRSGRRFIAVSCHYDIIDWLQPDWIFEPHIGEFARRKVRPLQLELQIGRIGHEVWKVFGPHHYLSNTLSKSSSCFAGKFEGKLAVFTAVLPGPNVVPFWREHRTVCLPDFQGVGFGNAMSEFVAGLYRATGRSYQSVTSHPSFLWHRARSRNWVMKRKPSRVRVDPQKPMTSSAGRLTSSFEYTGPVYRKEAKLFGVI